MGKDGHGDCGVAPPFAAWLAMLEGLVPYFCSLLMLLFELQLRHVLLPVLWGHLGELGRPAWALAHGLLLCLPLSLLLSAELAQQSDAPLLQCAAASLQAR
jgi:hypothetical protein